MTHPVLPEDSAPPNTTAEQNLVTAGQRRINVIWERTQQVIALVLVVITTLIAAIKTIYDMLTDSTHGVGAGPAFLFLSSASNLVIGFYFGRTNHTKTGGVPAMPLDR